ncbi:hypothetical protein N7G274_003856 [Stereocaulon virgatum]|uniref:Trafficking protein particle complex II-specific subunit 65 IgD3 domain-containing protein n=1 Tax=Stereocaulon virgatum TaxID=373712 RepID=A0ABR4AFQ8_9LECA
MSVISKDFIQNSKLDVLIPQATEIDIEEAFANNDEHAQADIISLIEQRALLYFDESLPVYIALRTPYKNEAHLKSCLTRLAIILEVLAYGFQPRPSGGKEGSKESSPSRNEDTLWSGNIDTSEEPITIVQDEGEQNSETYVVAIWRKLIPLCRPRMRLQSPMIIFKPSATLRPIQGEWAKEIRDPVLPSGVPASINLLESLKGDPTLQGAVPKLSASRLVSVQPQTYDHPTSDGTLKLNAQKAFRALPAISSRVRYSKSNGPHVRPSVIACLDLETAPFSRDNIKLTKLDMQLSDGSAEKLGKGHAPTLPLICKAKDNPVFLYRLTPNEALHDSSTSNSTRTVLISVHFVVLVSDTCLPNIEMRWRTSVDFSTALNPTYGAPGQSMQRPRRPSSLSRTPAAASATKRPVSSGGADSSSMPGAYQARERAVFVSDFGVSITFMTPKAVQVGQPFSWDVMVLNRSSKPRELILTVIPKRRNGSVGGHTARASPLPAGGHDNSSTAETVIDENVLYAMQRHAGKDAAHVISLNTDVRIGPLQPDSCLSTELNLLPLAQGYLQIEAVRVTDVVSNESIDVKDLPDIVAEGREA